jgi:hypothetical protein
MHRVHLVNYRGHLVIHRVLGMAGYVILTEIGTFVQGVSMQRVLRLKAQRDGPESVKFDFVFVAGHFLGRDENIFTYFQGHNINVSGDSGKSAPWVLNQLVSTPPFSCQEFLTI